MSTDRDVTRIVRSWLEDGATALPDRVLDNVLDQLPATSQRRAWWPAWRLREMNSALKFAIAATAVVVVAIVGINLLPGNDGVGVPRAKPDRAANAKSDPVAIAISGDDPGWPAGGGQLYVSSRLRALGVCARGRLAASKRARRTTPFVSRSRFRMAGQGSIVLSFQPSRATRHQAEQPS